MLSPHTMLSLILRCPSVYSSVYNYHKWVLLFHLLSYPSSKCIHAISFHIAWTYFWYPASFSLSLSLLISSKSSLLNQKSLVILEEPFTKHWGISCQLEQRYPNTNSRSTYLTSSLYLKKNSLSPFCIASYQTMWSINTVMNSWIRFHALDGIQSYYFQILVNCCLIVWFQWTLLHHSYTISSIKGKHPR